jgi:tetratricopeptide (TPR) repeat protein
LVVACSAAAVALDAQDPDRAAKIYADSSKSVFLLIVKSETGEPVAQGTGFLVSGGKIVTNQHVASGGSVLVDLGTAKIPTTIERVDLLNDLALLSPGAELAGKPLTIAEALPSPGSPVYAIGNPAGLERSISTGVVSGIRQMSGRQLIQVTCPISPGSSGGPILNARGEVVGVAVGVLESGQNLNFAVPASLVLRLIRPQAPPGTDFPSLIDTVDALVQRRGQFPYSTEPESDYQKLDREVDAALQSALERAAGVPDLLLQVAAKAQWQNNEIALTAAERAVGAKSVPETNLALGSALHLKAILTESTADKSALMDRSERSLRAALGLSKQPTYEIYYQLADLLEDRGNYLEADAFFLRALDASKARSNSDGQAASLRGLIRTAYALQQAPQGNKWFEALVSMGVATALDWQSQGKRLDGVRAFREAGQSYLQSARLGGAWTNWCEASGSLSLVSGEEDAVLSSARQCLSDGVGKPNSEPQLAEAHREIANVLNRRGVYQEALSHAKESSVLAPSSAWAFQAQAEALVGLRRFQEAINASNQAIRLSDGKYGTMHFVLGSAYFDLENWEFARQSFEKAAQLEPKDDAAPYNVALCLARLHYYGDAANWYEEVLRRNPNHPQKQDILNKIQVLRR